MKRMVSMSMFATAFIAKKPEATYIFRGLVGVEVEEKDGKVVVKKVLPDSPAERGGVKDGDVIVQFRDKEITKLADLEKVAAIAADKEVELVVERSGSQKTIQLTTARGF
jgi:S1-C subfamily serine protease